MTYTTYRQTFNYDEIVIYKEFAIVVRERKDKTFTCKVFDEKRNPVHESRELVNSESDFDTEGSLKQEAVEKAKRLIDSLLEQQS